MGGHVILIKSVLSSIPIEFLSCFRCPKNVIQRIEKMQRDFLWNDSMEKRKFHLVNWRLCVNLLIRVVWEFIPLRE